MSSAPANRAAENPKATAPLSRVLDQSERVQDKVEKAASDLTSVNAVLKGEISEKSEQVPLANVGRALDQSEAVEVKVHEAADELVAVNDALAQELDERHAIEERMTKSDVALAASRVEARKSRHDALHDALTGLPNLTLFNDRLRNALAQAQRHGWRLAVMFIDLDDFKDVNDTHGHDVGDEVLHMISQRLQEAVRGGDTVSRRSGDEFLLLMLEAKDQTNAAAFAARVAANIAAPCAVKGLKIAVKASIGISVYPEDGVSPEDLLKHADVAMYVAKKKRVGVTFFSEIKTKQTAKA